MATDERYIDDAFGCEDDALSAHTVLEGVASPLTLAAVGTLNGFYFSSVVETLELFGRIVLNCEEWECWVLSTTQLFPSIYSGFDFNSFAHFNGVDFAANETGVYSLDSTLDDGQAFNTGILFHPTAFGTTSRKKFRKVFVSAQGSRLFIEATTDNGRRVFELRRSEANITRDLRGRKWTFAIEGFDVFDFFEAFPVTLTR